MEKARKKQGFTMGELLIVVAIIGIMVSISIPIFTSQLKKARIATNQANARAAKAAALAAYQNNPDLDGKYVMYWYMTATGQLLPMGEWADNGNSFVYKTGDDRLYDDTFSRATKMSGIKGGDVSNLSEANKEFMGNEIVDKWGVKINLEDNREVDGITYKRGEIMMLVYDMPLQQGGGWIGGR